MTGPDLNQRGAGDIRILPVGLAEQAETRGAAHRHDIEPGEPHLRSAVLGHVTDDRRRMPPSPVELLEAEDGTQQRRLAAPVRPEDRHGPPARDIERQLREQAQFAEGECRIADSDHGRPTRLKCWRRSTAKTGAPISAVRTPRGISAAVRVRARVSTSTR